MGREAKAEEGRAKAEERTETQRAEEGREARAEEGRETQRAEEGREARAEEGRKARAKEEKTETQRAKEGREAKVEEEREAKAEEGREAKAEEQRANLEDIQTRAEGIETETETNRVLICMANRAHGALRPCSTGCCSLRRRCRFCSFSLWACTVH